MTKLTIGRNAPNITTLDTGNNPVQSDSLWADGPTVLTFLRHFG